MTGIEDELRTLVREVVREELASAGDFRIAPHAKTLDPPQLDKAVYSAEEVAALLGCSLKALYAKNARLQIPGGFKVGRRLQFRGAVLVAWLRDGRAPSAGGTRR